MLVRDIFTRPAVSVGPEATVRLAVEKLTKDGFALLPVIDERGVVVGVVSESDAMGAPSSEAPVSDIMSVPAEVIGPTVDVATLAERMAARGLRSVPVVELGLLVGIVSRRDVLRAMASGADIVASEIRALLDDYAGSRRQWSIHVDDGIVEISGAFADDAERRLVDAMSRTVDGVRNVHIVPTSAALLGGTV